MEQHELRTSIERSLGDASVDADELDNIIRQLRKCDVPAIARDRLLVALGDGETSEEDKALLMKYCPEEVPKQKADIFDVLIIYQSHLKLLYEDYAKNPGKDPAFTKERFEMMLKDMGVLGSDFKKNRSDMVFERVVQQRAQRNMDGTIKKAKTLTEPEFIHALIRLAYIKFSKLIGVHDKFIWMLKRFICAHEKCLEVDDEMPLNMDSGKVKGLITDKKRMGNLKKTFARYGEKRDGQAVMTLSQFMGMLKSANILPNDEILTERECRFCFLATNDDETATVEPMGGMTANSAVIVSCASSGHFSPLSPTLFGSFSGIVAQTAGSVRSWDGSREQSLSFRSMIQRTHRSPGSWRHSVQPSRSLLTTSSRGRTVWISWR